MRSQFLFLLFLLLNVSAGVCGEDTSDLPSQTVAHQVCSEEKTLKVQFLCNPDWQLQTEKNAMHLIISDDPAVTLTIAKADSPVIFIEQLTDKALKAMGQYQDGFFKARVKVASQDAVKVEGLSEQFPEIRLVDFYVIHDLSLYSILFSVNPKGEWFRYAAVLEKIIQSFQFMDE